MKNIIDLRKPDLRKHDLRKVPIGTEVITSKGFTFVLLDDKDGKETWLDLVSKLKWYDIEQGLFTYDQALRQFNSKNRRLPTIEEFREAHEHGIIEILPNIDAYVFWSSSVHSNSTDFAFVFYGNFVVVFYVYRNVKYGSVRCVGK